MKVIKTINKVNQAMKLPIFSISPSIVWAKLFILNDVLSYLSLTKGIKRVKSDISIYCLEICRIRFIVVIENNHDTAVIR